MKGLIKRLEMVLRARKDDFKVALVYFFSMAVVIVLSTYFQTFFIGLGGVTLMAVFGFFFVLVMVIAGYAVFVPLVKVSAAMTFFIFIAQTLCAVEHSQTSIDALKFVFGTSVLCMGYEFFRELLESVKKVHKKFKGENEKWSFGDYLVAFFFFGFVSLFLCSLFVIIKPIFFSLCIYK
jgi:hypothetical protein